MGIKSASQSFTRFKIIDPVTDDLLLRLPDRLRLFAFRDIDDTSETRSFGWVPHDDMLNLEWENASPKIGAYIIFSLRLDTRRIPPSVIKKHVALALKKEAKPEGRNFISKNRKKEITESVTNYLLSRTLPIPAVFDTLWNVGKNEVFFFSVQNKMIDLFMEFFLNSFELRLERITPFSLAQSLLDEDLQEEALRLAEAPFIYA